MRQGSYQRRTIPANTGRMVKLPECTCFPRDHPREYGENHHTRYEPTYHYGPSPRIRGEYLPYPLPYDAARTIPANTGRIDSSARKPQRRRDHPREYGENSSFNPTSFETAGPSPRIRGEWSTVTNNTFMDGTIPANTGRMRRRRTAWANRRDHPREYGENLATIGTLVLAPGPSPRIRGESGRKAA